MSRAEIERLYHDVQNDAELKKDFQELSDDKAAWVKLAQTKGYRITTEDTVQASAELSDEDLEKVAGGWSLGCDTNTINPTIGA